MAIIPSLRSWPTIPNDTINQRFYLRGPLAAESYLRFFRRAFWETDFLRQGHDALKLTTAPVPALLEWEAFTWRDVDARYGAAASLWMRYAWVRLKDEADTQLLWIWLYYNTVMRIEAQLVARRWAAARAEWLPADRAAWRVLLGVGAAYDALRAELARRRPRADEEDDPRAWGVAPPPVEAMRALFAALADGVRHFNVEAVFVQNFAAMYVRLEEGPVKQSIFDMYAEKMRTRMELIYIAAIAAFGEILKRLDDMQTQSPRDAQWLYRDEAVVFLLGEVRCDLGFKLLTTVRFFEVVRDIFSDDPRARRVGVEQLAALPSGATRKLARRIERMARFQYGALGPGDARKQVADEWMQILQGGDVLRDPPAGSEAADINARLVARTATIDQHISAQQEALRDQIPDPTGGKVVPESGLQTHQPSPCK